MEKRMDERGEKDWQSAETSMVSEFDSQTRLSISY